VTLITFPLNWLEEFSSDREMSQTPGNIEEILMETCLEFSPAR
jgi:hypothetical protein